MNDEVLELTCQVKHKDGKRCGKILASACGFVVPTGRTLQSVMMQYRDPSIIAVWCKSCHMASEFKIITHFSEAA